MDYITGKGIPICYIVALGKEDMRVVHVKKV
jgi:hypothetical protein